MIVIDLACLFLDGEYITALGKFSLSETRDSWRSAQTFLFRFSLMHSEKSVFYSRAAWRRYVRYVPRWNFTSVNCAYISYISLLKFVGNLYSNTWMHGKKQRTYALGHALLYLSLPTFTRVRFALFSEYISNPLRNVVFRHRNRWISMKLSSNAIVPFPLHLHCSLPADVTSACSTQIYVPVKTSIRAGTSFTRGS